MFQAFVSPHWLKESTPSPPPAPPSFSLWGLKVLGSLCLPIHFDFFFSASQQLTAKTAFWHNDLPIPRTPSVDLHVPLRSSWLSSAGIKIWPVRSSRTIRSASFHTFTQFAGQGRHLASGLCNSCAIFIKLSNILSNLRGGKRSSD